MECLTLKRDNGRCQHRGECVRAVEGRTTVDQLYPDIWQQIFKYFDTMELFTGLVHITKAADQVLFDKNHRFRFRGLVVDAFVETLPKDLSFNQLVSIEFHQESCIDIIEQCSELRSLKLVGQSNWIIDFLENVSHHNKKFEQLTLVVPGIGLLPDILASIAPMFSLRQLEIHANQFEEKLKTDVCFPVQTSIERFVLDSCSPIGWDEFSCILSSLYYVRSLDITLFHQNKHSFSSFIFPNLHHIRLMLIEVSFEWIIHLVKTLPALKKLKLNGLIDSEGYVVNHKWIDLFHSCCSLVFVTVNLSLENDTYSFCDEMIKIFLRKINLNLRSIHDDDDACLSEMNRKRWWKLSGIMIRHHTNAYHSTTRFTWNKR